MLKRINALLSIQNGCFTRTRNFDADHLYASFHLDTELFDELTFIDITGGKSRKNFITYLDKMLKNSFLPVTVGGGIYSLDDCYQMFDLGIDRVILNSALLENPKVIEKISLKYGAQSIVASLDVKKITEESYTAFNWRSKCTYDKLIPDIIISDSQLIGEIMIQSFDRDGTILGFDKKILDALGKFNLKSLPLNLASGFAKWSHYSDLLMHPQVDCVSVQNVHHLSSKSIKELKNYCSSLNISIRI